MAAINQQSLQQMSVNNKTWSRYMQAVRQFTGWRQQQHRQWKTEVQLDHLLAQYINQQYRQYQGRHRQHCVELLCGFLKLYPQFGFANARLALRGWSRQHPSKSWPPMSWDLAVLVAKQMAQLGYLRAAILTLLTHDCYLRIGEACQMRIQDVLLPGDPRAGSAIKKASISIAQGKTGSNQAVYVRRTSVTQLLHGLKRHLPSTALIGDINTSTYRRLFKKCCHQLQLDNCHFVPHSLRHGGALNDYLMDIPIADIMRRGRWQREASMKIYLRTCQGNLVHIQLPASIERQAKYWSSRPLEALSTGYHHSR
jgi:integrase